MKIKNKFHRASWLKIVVGTQEDVGNIIKVRIIGLLQLIYFLGKYWPVMQITNVVSYQKNKQVGCGWVRKLGAQLHQKIQPLQFYI